MKYVRISIGNGKTIVEFFSADIVFNVCKQKMDPKLSLIENFSDTEKGGKGQIEKKLFPEAGPPYH